MYVLCLGAAGVCAGQSVGYTGQGRTVKTPGGGSQNTRATWGLEQVRVGSLDPILRTSGRVEGVDEQLEEDLGREQHPQAANRTAAEETE